MTLKERLEFCSICTSRKVDHRTGMFCGVTQEKPAFENKCESFNKDEEEASRRLELKLKAKGNAHTEHGSVNPTKNKLYGLLVSIIGLGVLLFVSLVIGIAVLVTGVSFIIKGFHQDKVLRENKRFNEKLAQ